MVDTARANGAEHMVRAFRTLALLLTVACAAACSVKDTSTPALSGPSELGLSLAMAATPDIISQDGVAQSQVVVIARDSTGKTLPNVTMRLEITQGGTIVDFGTLSSKTVVTGSDGRATAVYTAPKAPVVSVASGTIVSVLATPISSNYANAVARAVDIRLVPIGVIQPPSDLVAGFTFTPDSPAERDSVLFTATPCSSTVILNCTGGSVTSYAWTFGDGGTGSGQNVTHAFASGSFPVTLTVRDAAGRAVSATRTVTVKVGSNPTASFVTSPGAPLVGQPVFFNAAASQAATGRSIVDYQWSFGDGGTGRGVSASHTFDVKGSFTVVLVVVDDAGRQGTSTSTVTIGSQAVPTANFTATASATPGNHTVVVDATGSSAVAPATIVSYDWDFGNGARDVGAVRTYTYGAAGTYAITLTVTDSSGKTSTIVKSVTVL
jgi:PKD repeat protein